ncbi:hypothetical protein [Luteolibacter marinus]|uniref:hypothetical protein n=1 Tax=Luteolibacter marinus TaxID=2776705 RepID=UPI00186872C9|nr:hypothetical protein [Luteolibacter marinus]
MITTVEPYTLFFIWKDGKIAAVQRENKTVLRDDDGNVISETTAPAVEVPLPIPADVLGEIATAALAELETIKASHATELEAKDAAHAEAVAKLEASHAEAIAAALGQPKPDIGAKLAGLNAAFKAAVPEDQQHLFTNDFATIRVLLQAGKDDLARKHLAAIAVPPELEEAKAGMLAMISD